MAGHSSYPCRLGKDQMGHEVDFLRVGDGEKSGDAIAIRFGDLHGPRAQQNVMVIDGGYRESGRTLVDHIKTAYRTDTVDLVIATHSDSDHISGLFEVVEQLKVGCLAMHLPWNHTVGIAGLFRDGRVTDMGVRDQLRRSLEDAHALEKVARRKGIRIVEPFQGVNGFDNQVLVLGPSQQYYESLLPLFRGTPAPALPLGLLGILGQAADATRDLAARVFETLNFETLDDSGETSAENNSSVITLLQVDGRALLLTADAGMPALTHAADYLDQMQFDNRAIRFIQVPHHGSRRNVGPTILNRLLGPPQASDAPARTAFVSVSKEAPAKHPSKRVVNAFRRRGALVHSTHGMSKRHHFDAPKRAGWVPSVPLPFYDVVEE